MRRSDVVVVAPLFVLLAFTGCRRKPEAPEPEVAQRPAAAKPEELAPVIPSFEASTFTAQGRVVAVGDVHGDFDALHQSLKLGGLVNEEGKWIGGNATLVQTGDVLDRGDDEQKILDYLRALREDARAAGGQVVLLNGNHEVMNVAGDLRYVTAGGFTDFQGLPGLDLDGPGLAKLPPMVKPRMAAFRPGGPYAVKLADYPIVAIVNDSVFAHGGVLPSHVEYGIDRLNDEVSRWMRGEADAPVAIQNDEAPIWTRVYSDGDADCATLERTLKLLGAKRMVVGHTVQKDGITSACDGKVWRIDVGMSAHYGGRPAALEIGERVEPLGG